MISTDRYGTALRLGPTLPVDFKWSIRLVDNQGSFSSSTNWVRYELPTTSVISRNRSTALDGGTWQLQLTILAAALPDSLSTLANGYRSLEYFTLEVDLVGPDGQIYPYHTGPIDSVSEGFSVDNGAIVATLEIASFGVLQRLKKASVPRFAFANDYQYFDDYRVCIWSEARILRMTTGTVGTPVAVLGAVNTIDAQIGSNPAVHSDAIQVTTDSTFATINRTYGVDYTITNSAGGAALDNDLPIYINWITAVPATYYVKVWVVSYVGINVYWTPGNASFRCPDGRMAFGYGGGAPKRRLSDDFATEIVSGSTTTALTVLDPEPYRQTNYLVGVTGFPTDVLEYYRVSTNTYSYHRISSTTAAGVINLTDAVSSTPDVGDIVRLVSTQLYVGHIRGNATVNWAGLASYTFPVFTDKGRASVYPMGTFEPAPDHALWTLNRVRHFSTAVGAPILKNETWLYSGYGVFAIQRNSANTTEQLVSQILTGYVESSKVTTGNALGSYVKTFVRENKTLAEILEDAKKDGFPPNAFVHDRVDGGVITSAFVQATNAQARLTGIRSIVVEDEPEPITQVEVISRASDENEWLNITGMGNPRTTTGVGSFTLQERLLDGVEDSINGYSQSANLGVWRFTIPEFAGLTIPTLTTVRVFGTSGFFVAKLAVIENSTNTQVSAQFIDGGKWFQLVDGKPAVLEKEPLVAAYTAAKYGVFGTTTTFSSSYSTVLDLIFYADTSWTGAPAFARITEIQYYSDVKAAWTALLTSDTTGSPPTGWTTLNDQGLGSLWWQADLTLPYSQRYVDSNLEKRIQPKYASSWRTTIRRSERIELTNLSFVDCRRIAERYLDEFARGARRYQVVADLNPVLEPGDTVELVLPDGSSKTLFVWSISDTGSSDELQASYSLVDYSA